MNMHSGRMWREVAIFAAVILIAGVVFFTAIGQPQSPMPAPLQSPIETIAQPTATVAPTVDPRATATSLIVPTVESTPPFFSPPGTPDMRSTSLAVIATLTAQAIPPTLPPVPTPRPIGAGPGQPVAPLRRTPTPLPDPSGIMLLSLSDKVYAGGAVALTIRTQPGAACYLQAMRTQADGSAHMMTVPGGAARRAGSDGVIAWIWTLSTDEPAGPATLFVSCDGVGSVQYQIEVVK